MLAIALAANVPFKTALRDKSIERRPSMSYYFSSLPRPTWDACHWSVENLRPQAVACRRKKKAASFKAA